MKITRLLNITLRSIFDVVIINKKENSPETTSTHSLLPSGSRSEATEGGLEPRIEPAALPGRLLSSPSHAL